MSHLIALLGRILMSAIFIQGGINKALAPASTIAMMGHLALPVPAGAYIVAVLVEILGGIAVLVGWRARWAAVVLFVWCIATALIAHYHPGDRGQMINFMKNIAMAGGFLQLAAWGAGRFSLDRR
ncbi:MAG: DoxX family protein [Alphaproteobacteria bacterium]|nr:DoxX family protein [Alphaproteobacteria bacterium]